MKRTLLYLSICGFIILVFGIASAWTPIPVKDDPLLRMPGSQPEQGISLEGSNRCLNCHAGYNSSVEPGYNWMGSMMAQAARDPIWYACLTVAMQDSIWAIGTPNATDLCVRCHSPAGWLGGNSDPTNLSALTGDDFDGLSCDFCHRKFDPFFDSTYNGEREGDNWISYWDEAGNSGPGSQTLSQTSADETFAADTLQALGIKFFSGGDFYLNDRPLYATYTEDGSGQFFVSSDSAKRASFADAAARHQMLYSRHHKSKHFCGTCHDVSNPVLANLGVSGLPDQSDGDNLITEQYSAFRYFHVERTFSEFMLSAYGQQGGAPTNADFQAQGAPGITHAAKCQDCHMRDVVGVAANKNGAPVRPEESTEHPNSGLPLHDMTGGNVWVSHILASLDPNGPVPDSVNQQLLGQGPSVLTLDLNAGQSPVNNGAALKAGSDRALQQLQLAATIKNVTYDPVSGNLAFRVQNNTGHKLISGFPEGRRMFVNIQAYQGGALIYEVNPYDYTAGTLKGLPNSTSSPALGANEEYVDSLVYEIHPSSTLTGEEETFHFVLATGRYKDNRIPPKGFNAGAAAERIALPVDHGDDAPDMYAPEEYAGGYDAVSLTIPNGADNVDVTLYYQGTSREYVEFLRDEINGNASTLTLPAPSGEPIAYVAQTDPFFSGLKAWGDTIWDLWYHNHGLDGKGASVPGIVPVMMAQASYGQTASSCDPPSTLLLGATPGHQYVSLLWQDVHTDDAMVLGYRIYYDQAGKSQMVEDVGLVTTYTDSNLTDNEEYCYKITVLYDVDGDSVADCESNFSNILCATPVSTAQPPAGVDQMETGYLMVSGKGGNKTTTYISSTNISLGDTVVIKTRVIDVSSGQPLSGASVDLEISGPESATVLSGHSDESGIATAEWSTSTPNRKGNGGTLPGSYSATVTGVSAGGYTWDGTMTSTTFTLQ
jgi:hypothetical protein